MNFDMKSDMTITWTFIVHEDCVSKLLIRMITSMIDLVFYTNWRKSPNNFSTGIKGVEYEPVLIFIWFSRKI